MTTLRSRFIRPGIVTNGELCELGPYAYILFTGLWMLADREGRLEDRPGRIKALVMPLWDACDVRAVEKDLENLCISGFIRRYKVDDVAYIQIVNWEKHQHPHQREAESECPAETASAAASARSEGTSQGRAKDMPRPSQSRLVTSYLNDGRGGPVGGYGGKSTKASPPPKKPTPRTQRRKPPQSERASRAEGGPREPKAQTRAPVDFAPYPPDEVKLLRESVDALAEQVRMAPPDDAMLRRIFDAGRGAGALEIHTAIVRMHRRDKFREMRSWGFLPIVLADAFDQRAVPLPASG